MKLRLIEKGAEEAYQHINKVYGVAVGLQNLFTDNERQKPLENALTKVVLTSLKEQLDELERETKAAYDWICAIKE